MRNEKECRNLIVKVKRHVNKWFKIDPSSIQQNLALQEQCENNLFKPSAGSRMKVSKDVNKTVTNLKCIEHETTFHPSSNLSKGCKPLIVKIQRINKFAHVKESTEQEVVPIQNKNIYRCENKMITRNSIKKDNGVYTSNSCKETADLLNVNKKQNGLIISSNQTIKGNIRIESLVLTSEHRKHLNKLSLSKCSGDRTAIDLNSTKTNSAKFDVDENTISDGKCESDLIDSNSKGKMVLRNVTNNSELIQQLICSNEDSEAEHGRREGKASHSISKGKRNLKHVTNNPDFEEDSDNPTRLKIKENNNTTNKFFQRVPKRKLSSGKEVTEPDNIFEFLSQSDTSESEVAKNQDPAADIIKKLISEGKVRVATNHKGTGRPILKRGRRTRKIQETDTNKVFKEKVNKKSNNVNKKLPKIVDIIHNCDGGTSLYTPSNLVIENRDVSMVVNNQQENFLTNNIPKLDEHVRDEGFSQLARTVLLQETRKVGNTYKSNISKQRRLLEVARKFVSTPAANRQITSWPIADISPVKFLSPQNRPVCPSPWRINDDSHLPSVFNFTKNKSYLPTFSSDYIPATPKKNKANSSEECIDTNVPILKPISIRHENCSNISRNTASSTSNVQLQTSLEPENDSNVENMSPNTLSAPNTDENAAICNLRQLPNPRRTLGKRSPLKTINILEVVSLPSWKKTDEINKKVDATVGDMAKNDKSNDEDLFGFEEFLDHSSDDDGETNKTNIKLSNRQSIKRNLHRKLKDIQKWRPKNSNQGNTCVSQQTSEIFEHNGPKQPLINEMLCSTMINMKNDKQKEQNNLENCNEVLMSDNEESNVQPLETDFFNDYEPETTFNKKKTLRTYVRPAKRKRKARKNFVMVQESAESNSDTEEEQLEQRKDGQKKRRLAANDNDKENSEIDAFVNEFNSICKDVENYELIVE